jgi:hypothetical protein
MTESAKKATIAIARPPRITKRYDGIDVRIVKQITRQSTEPNRPLLAGAVAASVRYCESPFERIPGPRYDSRPLVLIATAPVYA